MKHSFLFVVFFFCCSLVSAQSFSTIKTLKEAEKYVKAYNEREPKAETFYLPRDTVALYKAKYSNPNTKILELVDGTLFRADYLMFNDSKLSPVQRKICYDSIIKAFRNGATVQALLDKNKANNLILNTYVGWDSEGRNTFPELHEVLRKYKVGESFFFDNEAHAMMTIMVKTLEEKRTIFSYFTSQKDLDKVTNLEEAYEYIEAYKDKGPRVSHLVVDRENLKAALLTLTGPNRKVLNIRKSYKLRGQSIFFNESDSLTITQINRKRDSIIAAYKKGGSFEKMFEKYNGKSGAQLDLGWVDDFNLFPIFSAEMIKQPKGAIFKLDFDDRKTYLVCLKTHDFKLTYKISYVTREVR